MKKYILTGLTLFLLCANGFTQSFKLKTNGIPIENKVLAKLKFEERISETNYEYIIEVLFTGSYSLVKNNYRGYYKLYDKEGQEIYKSEIWKCGGYGGAAENYIIKKIWKDLKKKNFITTK